jgi:hypothetical protein
VPRVVAGLLVVVLAARLAGVPSRFVEGGLIGAVLLALALTPAVQRAVHAIDRPRRRLLAAMLALALAGQLALGTRLFPFIAWDMYAGGEPVRAGHVTTNQFDAVLRSGRRVPLDPAQFLGPESADRVSERLRRQTVALTARRGPAAQRLRSEQSAALRALARLYDAEHPSDPVTSVRVVERWVSVRSGEQSAPRVLWRVALR